jgi:hypothetical protein
MIAAARKRNAGHLKAGRLTLATAPIEDADLGDARFDVAFAFHVAALWRSPAAADAVRRRLAPEGALHLFDKPPRGDATAATRTAERVAERLRQLGFAVAAPEVGALEGSGHVTHLVARRPPEG